MKDLACPNCGGAQPQVLAPGEFKCSFCGQLFYNEAMRQQARADHQRQTKINAQVQQEQFKTQQMQAGKGSAKRVLIFVAFFLILIFSFVAYMAIEAANDQKEMQEEIMKQFSK
jgi:uncharacterized Zn finger protein (UPF0148 family)